MFCVSLRFTLSFKYNIITSVVFRLSCLVWGARATRSGRGWGWRHQRTQGGASRRHRRAAQWHGGRPQALRLRPQEEQLQSTEAAGSHVAQGRYNAKSNFSVIRNWIYFRSNCSGWRVQITRSGLGWSWRRRPTRGGTTRSSRGATHLCWGCRGRRNGRYGWTRIRLAPVRKVMFGLL